MFVVLLLDFKLRFFALAGADADVGKGLIWSCVVFPSSIRFGPEESQLEVWPPFFPGLQNFASTGALTLEPQVIVFCWRQKRSRKGGRGGMGGGGAPLVPGIAKTVTFFRHHRAAQRLSLRHTSKMWPDAEEDKHLA